MMLVNYMAEGGESKGYEHFVVQANGFPRDSLFNNLVNEKRKLEVDNGKAEEEGIELSLGLSLNGRFGVDPEKSTMKLMRSSSVSTFMLGGVAAGREECHTKLVPIGAYTHLSRTCSLPTESEQEWRKRKELQSLRRMEAKRRRMDKAKFTRVGREKVDLEDCSIEDNGSSGSNTSNTDYHGLDGFNGFENGIMVPSSHGSIGSHGSASSELSESDCQTIQVNKNNNEISHTSVRSDRVHSEQKPQVFPVSVVEKASGDKGTVEAKNMFKNVMDMPCVSTTGNGPNGKKIEGFLYRYRKGEDVKIMCVCHGNFLSPAEFVKHAGGTDVEHPLKHIIVVNPSPLS